jgi:polysaccharide export outer membrane protein
LNPLANPLAIPLAIPFRASLGRRVPRRPPPNLAALVLLTLLLALATACAPGRALAPLPPADAAGYRLGPGDAVRVITFGEEALTGEFRVSDAGTLALPLVGPVAAMGATPAELETRVAAAMRRSNLLRNPSVAVEVIAYRPI